MKIEENELEFKEIDPQSSSPENYSEKWIAKPGDTLTGYYEGITHAKSKNGRELTFHHITAYTTKKRYSILGCIVLNNKLKEVQLKDIVKIEYKGKQWNMNHTDEYRVYKVYKANNT